MGWKGKAKQEGDVEIPLEGPYNPGSLASHSSPPLCRHGSISEASPSIDTYVIFPKIEGWVWGAGKELRDPLAQAPHITGEGAETWERHRAEPAGSLGPLTVPLPQA